MIRSGLLCFFVLLSCPAWTQVMLGVRSGLNLSDVVINNYNDPDVEPGYDIKPGFHAGVFVTADGESKIGFSAELLYSSKGVRALNVINLHYVAVPLLLRYHLNDKFLAEIGPEIGYLVSANSKHGNVNSTWDNKVDVGLDAGLQYLLGKITIGARFNAGFTSVIRTTASGPNGQRVRYLNRVAQLSIAIPLRELY